MINLSVVRVFSKGTRFGRWVSTDVGEVVVGVRPGDPRLQTGLKVPPSKVDASGKLRRMSVPASAMRRRYRLIFKFVLFELRTALKVRRCFINARMDNPEELETVRHGALAGSRIYLPP